jgi:hypothetical protein
MDLRISLRFKAMSYIFFIVFLIILAAMEIGYGMAKEDNVFIIIGASGIIACVYLLYDKLQNLR